MKSYLEKLEKYKIAEETFKIAKKAFEEEKENLEEYVKQNIVLQEYTVKEIPLRLGYKVYYPILNLPDGFTIKSEEFWSDHPEDFFGEPDYLDVIRAYVLVEETTKLEIEVTEKTPRKELEYHSSDRKVQMKVKDKILVVSRIVEYDIKIDNMEFHFERDFENQLSKKIIEDMFKDKTICYKDFEKTSSYIRNMLTNRYCENHLLALKSDWRISLKEYVKNFQGNTNVNKVISDIEQVIQEGEFTKRIEKYYYFKREYTLSVVIQSKYTADNCIFYEDENMLLEIPSPSRVLLLGIGLLKVPYKEGEQLELCNQKIEELDIYTIRLDKLDMDKQMKLLDIITNSIKD